MEKDVKRVLQFDQEQGSRREAAAVSEGQILYARKIIKASETYRRNVRRLTRIREVAKKGFDAIALIGGSGLTIHAVGKMEKK